MNSRMLVGSWLVVASCSTTRPPDGPAPEYEPARVIPWDAGAAAPGDDDPFAGAAIGEWEDETKVSPAVSAAPAPESPPGHNGTGTTGGAGAPPEYAPASGVSDSPAVPREPRDSPADAEGSTPAADP